MWTEDNPHIVLCFPLSQLPALVSCPPETIVLPIEANSVTVPQSSTAVSNQAEL